MCLQESGIFSKKTISSIIIISHLQQKETAKNQKTNYHRYNSQTKNRYKVTSLKSIYLKNQTIESVTDHCFHRYVGTTSLGARSPRLSSLQLLLQFLQQPFRSSFTFYLGPVEHDPLFTGAVLLPLKVNKGFTPGCDRPGPAPLKMSACRKLRLWNHLQKCMNLITNQTIRLRNVCVRYLQCIDTIK